MEADIHSRLKEYETEQSQKRVLKPSGYAYRSLKLYDRATFFMCNKTLYSNQGFADHVQSCTAEDRLYSIVPKELVLGLEDGIGDDDNE